MVRLLVLPGRAPPLKVIPPGRDSVPSTVRWLATPLAPVMVIDPTLDSGRESRTVFVSVSITSRLVPFLTRRTLPPGKFTLRGPATVRVKLLAPAPPR